MYRQLPTEQLISDEAKMRMVDNVGLILNYIQSKKAEQPLVYHYTNGPGLIGIANNKTLWATHLGFMNDSMEYIEATKLISRMSMSRQQPGNLSQPAALSMIKLAEATGFIQADHYYPWFVTCFSECADDLAQWRGYSAGETKFALAFELNHLADLVRHQTQPDEHGRFMYRMYLAPVTYKDEEKHKIINMILDFICDQYPKDEADAKPDDQEIYMSNWLSWYASYASMITPVMKNKAFEQEREWRLIMMPIYRPIKYRSRRTMLTPYLEFDIECEPFKSDLDDQAWAHPIRECWIGPSPHMDQNRFAARNLLAGANIGGPKMELSRVPYRDL